MSAQDAGHYTHKEMQHNGDEMQMQNTQRDAAHEHNADEMQHNCEKL